MSKSQVATLVSKCPMCGDESKDWDPWGFRYCEKCRHCLHTSQSLLQSGVRQCDFCDRTSDDGKTWSGWPAELGGES